MHYKECGICDKMQETPQGILGPNNMGHHFNDSNHSITNRGHHTNKMKSRNKNTKATNTVDKENVFHTTMGHELYIETHTEVRTSHGPHFQRQYYRHIS